MRRRDGDSALTHRKGVLRSSGVFCQKMAESVEASSPCSLTHRDPCLAILQHHFGRREKQFMTRTNKHKGSSQAASTPMPSRCMTALKS